MNPSRNSPRLSGVKHSLSADAHSESDLPLSVEQSITFSFSSREFVELDFSRFQLLWSSGLLTSPQISKLRGNLRIEAPIPEESRFVPFLREDYRRFCEAFFEAFPYWGFFCSSQSLGLWNMAMALNTDLRVLQFEDTSRTRLVFQEESLATSVERIVSHALRLAASAGLNGAESAGLREELLAYFSKVATSYTTVK